MPRTADHAARRRQITSAVRGVAVADGLATVTVARTAAAAGVSVGLVQHYYASKEELLVETLGTVLDDVLARVDTASARAERRHARIERMMAAALEQLLPLDRVRQEETYLRHAFAALALDREVLRPHQRRFDELLTARAVRAIENGTRCGEVARDVDAPLEAEALLALAGGLASRLLVDDRLAHRRRARQAIAGRAAALFAGPCAREAATPGA